MLAFAGALANTTSGPPAYRLITATRASTGVVPVMTVPLAVCVTAMGGSIGAALVLTSVDVVPATVTLVITVTTRLGSLTTRL